MTNKQKFLITCKGCQTPAECSNNVKCIDEAEKQPAQSTTTFTGRWEDMGIYWAWRGYGSPQCEPPTKKRITYVQIRYPENKGRRIAFLLAVTVTDDAGGHLQVNRDELARHHQLGAKITCDVHDQSLPEYVVFTSPESDEQVTSDEAEAAYLEQHLPPWAERRIKPTDNEPYPLRAQLPTKDGRRTGNAVISAIIDSDLFEVTTDMGNVIMLNRAELEERFHAPEYVVSEEGLKDRPSTTDELVRLREMVKYSAIVIQDYERMGSELESIKQQALVQQAQEPVGEIMRSFSDASGLQVHLYGNLTSDTPGIVGAKIYTTPQPQPTGATNEHAESMPKLQDSTLQANPSVLVEVPRLREGVSGELVTAPQPAVPALSSRLRPNVECVPWVIDEVKKLEERITQQPPAPLAGGVTDERLLSEWDRVSHIAEAGNRRLAFARAILTLRPQVQTIGTCQTCGNERDELIKAEREIERLNGMRQQAVPAEFDVRKILLDVVPGLDGMAVEVYAKSVDGVVGVLTEMAQKLEDLGTTRHAAQRAVGPLLVRDVERMPYGLDEIYE